MKERAELNLQPMQAAVQFRSPATVRKCTDKAAEMSAASVRMLARALHTFSIEVRSGAFGGMIGAADVDVVVVVMTGAGLAFLISKSF